MYDEEWAVWLRDADGKPAWLTCGGWELIHDESGAWDVYLFGVRLAAKPGYWDAIEYVEGHDQ